VWLNGEGRREEKGEAGSQLLPLPLSSNCPVSTLGGGGQGTRGVGKGGRMGQGEEPRGRMEAGQGKRGCGGGDRRKTDTTKGCDRSMLVGRLVKVLGGVPYHRCFVRYIWIFASARARSSQVAR